MQNNDASYLNEGSLIAIPIVKDIIFPLCLAIFHSIQTMYFFFIETAKISGREAVGYQENSGERSSQEFVSQIIEELITQVANTEKTASQIDYENMLAELFKKPKKKAEK